MFFSSILSNLSLVVLRGTIILGVVNGRDDQSSDSCSDKVSVLPGEDHPIVLITRASTLEILLYSVIFFLLQCLTKPYQRRIQVQQSTCRKEYLFTDNT